MKRRAMMTMTKGQRMKDICDDDDSDTKGLYLKAMVITMMLMMTRMKRMMMMTMTKRHI